MRKFLAGLFIAMTIFAHGGQVSAAACSNENNYGMVTASINVPVDGEYIIWSRMQVPNASNSTYKVEVGGNTCIEVGGSDVTPDTWVWVDHKPSGEADKVKHTFNSGNQQIKLIGTKTGVRVDKIILLGINEACSSNGSIPEGDGSNCASGPAPKFRVAVHPATRNLTDPTRPMLRFHPGRQYPRQVL